MPQKWGLEEGVRDRWGEKGLPRGQLKRAPGVLKEKRDNPLFGGRKEGGSAHAETNSLEPGALLRSTTPKIFVLPYVRPTIYEYEQYSCYNFRVCINQSVNVLNLHKYNIYDYSNQIYIYT